MNPPTRYLIRYSKPELKKIVLKRFWSDVPGARVHAHQLGFDRQMAVNAHGTLATLQVEGRHRRVMRHLLGHEPERHRATRFLCDEQAGWKKTPKSETHRVITPFQNKNEN